MFKILSLPPNLVGKFNEITGLPVDEWFATSDPDGAKVGSGGGTAWALTEYSKTATDKTATKSKKIIIHAGGQSRRLPAYAPSGKILTPVPVFRWSRGQSVRQNLLSLQVPLYEAIMGVSSSSQNTLVASGDVLTLTAEPASALPDADVVCYGIWSTAQTASNHGVFFMPRSDSGKLDFMLQKPSHDEIERLSATHMFLMDVGIWVLSDRAVSVLMRKSGWNGQNFEGGVPRFYDLYSEFGTALGVSPTRTDADITPLSVAIVTLSDSGFYHFGTSPELISSTERIQNLVVDQRHIWHHKVKPQPSIFVQNSQCEFSFSSDNENIWVENSHIGANWKLTKDNIITGVPANDWKIEVPPGICIDIVPIGAAEYAVRPYGIGDKFRGRLSDKATTLLGEPFGEWLSKRGITFEEAHLEPDTDIQSTDLFPVASDIDAAYRMLRFMIFAEGEKSEWLAARRMSAETISAEANLERLMAQRNTFLTRNLPQMAANYRKSVFYQTDLADAARLWRVNNLPLPAALPDSEPPLTLMRDMMFRSEVKRFDTQGVEESKKAFEILRTTIRQSVTDCVEPTRTVSCDQIVWGRSPARLDLAGGWADTPPFCLQEGGSVVNIAVDLNGQPPIQVFVRHTDEPCIKMHSIDNGVAETVSTFDEVKDCNRVGSAFSIVKAALCLAGFHPEYCAVRYGSLHEQLAAFGGGMEITTLVAIPKGSGLGTSSILAATVLSSLSDFCGLSWTRRQICHRTLVLEQMLTTGGGWQDQYGGVFQGVKLLESAQGSQEHVSVKWLPSEIFSDKSRWLLYYTGITRVAKNILDEIVRGMFLNENKRLETLNHIKKHAYKVADAIQNSDIDEVGRLLKQSWKLNCALDSGTTTPEIDRIVEMTDNYSLGYKLLGAGGGGYMLICAKDADAASLIRNVLTQEAPNDKARFVDMSVSNVGLQISRS